MKRQTLILLGIILLATLVPLHAQDVTITNARIVVANGTVIERGSIVVRGGKIVSVASGAPAAASGMTIDAKGMTAMPGFIDAHRHINTGPEREGANAGAARSRLHNHPVRRRSGGRKHHASGSHREGPDQWTAHIPSGALRLNNNTPETARAEIRKMAEMGIKFTGEIALTPVPGQPKRNWKFLGPSWTKAKKAGVMVQVHAVSSKAMVAAVDAGVPLLVHLPNKDFMSKEDAKKLAASGTKILGTVGFGTPVFGVFAEDNLATVPRREAVARIHRRRSPSRRRSRIYARKCAHRLGCRRHSRLLHRYDL